MSKPRAAEIVRENRDLAETPSSGLYRPSRDRPAALTACRSAGFSTLDGSLNFARMSDELSRVIRERDLYWQLLELGSCVDIETFLEQALGLFLQLAGARCGHIEVGHSLSDAVTPSFSLSRGLEDETLLPGGSVRTGMNEALASGETVLVAESSFEPRFQEHGSVRARALGALSCALIGRAPVGVVYLQDRSVPFSADDRRRVDAVARHVGSFADRLLTQRLLAVSRDPSSACRRSLRAEGVVGASEAIAEVLKQVSLVARLDVGVFLTGPCGSGKTQLARVIHDSSVRASAPFVELDCATLSPERIEAELFGASPAGDQGTPRRAPGKVEAAQGGTLFLDHVCELPLRQQAELLELLQSGTYCALGDTKRRRADVRVIAATSVELETAIADKRFREDLYYRLGAVRIRLPSLAERRSDIAVLARHFCKATSAENGFAVRTLSLGAERALEHADWPGNVRELAHVVELAALRAHADGSAAIERRHLFPHEARASRAMTFHEETRAFQRALLCATLAREDWNVTAASRSLDLTRAHVYNLMATLGIQRPGEAAEG